MVRTILPVQRAQYTPEGGGGPTKKREAPLKRTSIVTLREMARIRPEAGEEVSYWIISDHVMCVCVLPDAPKGLCVDVHLVIIASGGFPFFPEEEMHIARD